MIALTEFLVKKHQTNNIEHEDTSNYCCVLVFDDDFEEMKKHYADALTNNRYYCEVFIVPISELKTITSLCKECDILMIPSKYKSIDDFEEDYNNGEIDPDGLEKYEGN